MGLKVPGFLIPREGGLVWFDVPPLYYLTPHLPTPPKATPFFPPYEGDEVTASRRMITNFTPQSILE